MFRYPILALASFLHPPHVGRLALSLLATLACGGSERRVASATAEQRLLLKSIMKSAPAASKTEDDKLNDLFHGHCFRLISLFSFKRTFLIVTNPGPSDFSKSRVCELFIYLSAVRGIFAPDLFSPGFATSLMEFRVQRFACRIGGCNDTRRCICCEF